MISNSPLIPVELIRRWIRNATLSCWEKLDQFKEFADEIGLSQRLADEIAATEAELFVDT